MPTGVPENLMNQKFGLLTVTGPFVKDGRRRWVCLCACGGAVCATTGNLKCGGYTNCGCTRTERKKLVSLTHGHTKRAQRTKEYRAWSHLIGRCTTPTDSAWKNYGGRGIRVCDEWAATFEAFLNDVGLAPSSDHSIDRIDVDGNYEPGNVRWATRKEQARNTRRAIWLGDRLLRDIVDERGLKWKTVSQRIRRGATPEQAISDLAA